MTRMLRRVTGGNVLPNVNEDDDKTSDEDVQKTTNRFKLLVAESEESDDKEERIEEVEQDTQPTVKKNVKKKKRRSKKKPSPYAELAAQLPDNFDQLVEDFLKSYEDAGPSRSDMQNSDGSIVHILSVKPNHLNERHEIKKKFGFEVPSTFTGHDIARHKLSRFIAEVLPYYPQLAMNSGLSMQMINKDGGLPHFVFVHSKAYQSVTHQVIQALHAGDVHMVADLYSTLPYQIDLILQMADIAKQSEEMDKCIRLVEQAIYILEKAFDINFCSKMLTFACRLPYMYQVNRCFFRVIFYHINLLTSRASHRTALECAKLLFGLDPNDPLTVVLIMDSLALKSKEYAWLVKFVDALQARGRGELPNQLYSRALALYHLNKKDDITMATESLKMAIAKYPHLIPMMATELPALAKKLPANFNKHAAFNPEKASSCLVKQYYPMYIKYSSSQWERDEDILDWVAETVSTIFTDPSIHETDLWLENKIFRKEIFSSTPIAVQRHIFFSEMDDIPLAVNGSVLSSILSWDPLPPAKSIDIYKVQIPEIPQGLSNLTNSVMGALFRSLNPTFDVNN